MPCALGTLHLGAWKDAPKSMGCHVRLQQSLVLGSAPDLTLPRVLWGSGGVGGVTKSTTGGGEVCSWW